MIHSPDHRFDQSTYDALTQLAQQPGDEELHAPVDDQDRLQLINFAPAVKTMLSVTVRPDIIHVERVDGVSFGIADYSHDREHPIAVLGQRVTSLTVERSGNVWAVRQHSEQPLVIDNADSFERFWQVLAMYVQDKRTRTRQRTTS